MPAFRKRQPNCRLADPGLKEGTAHAFEAYDFANIEGLACLTFGGGKEGRLSQKCWPRLGYTQYQWHSRLQVVTAVLGLTLYIYCCMYYCMLYVACCNSVVQVLCAAMCWLCHVSHRSVHLPPRHRAHRDDQSAFSFLIAKYFGYGVKTTQQAHLDSYVHTLWRQRG